MTEKRIDITGYTTELTSGSSVLIDPKFQKIAEESDKVSDQLTKAGVHKIFDIFELEFTEEGEELFRIINPYIVYYLIKTGRASTEELSIEDWRSLPWKKILKKVNNPIEQICNRIIFTAWVHIFFDLKFEVHYLPMTKEYVLA